MKVNFFEGIATMSYQPSKRTKGSLPPASFGALLLLIISGSVATIAFDLWGQAISPGLLGWAKLAPVGLATQTVQTVFGFRSVPAGHFMHLFLVGLIAYPFGWVYIARPILERLMPGLPLIASSAIYGFGLFVFAIGIIAGPLFAGNPWFLNWTGITYVALIGHVLYGIVVAYAANYLEGNDIG